MTTTAETRKGLKSVNPFTGELLKTYEEMTPADVDAAIGEANSAYREWRETSYEHRAQILRRAADLFGQFTISDGSRRVPAFCGDT